MSNYIFLDSTTREAARFLSSDVGKTAFQDSDGTFWQIASVNNLTHLATWTQTGGYGGGAVSSLTTTGTSGASTLASGVLNIPQYQGQLTLTTTGSSGASTLVGNTLNIPQYSGGGGIALTDLSATSPLTYNNTTGVFGIQNATTTQAGALTSTDWNTFNNKQAAVSLTTTGTTGVATFSSDTLNIPQYQGALTLTTTGTSGASTLVGNTLNIPQYTGGGGGASNFSTVSFFTDNGSGGIPIGNQTLDLSSYVAGDLLHVILRISATNSSGGTRTLVFSIDSLTFTDGATLANGATCYAYIDAYIPLTDGVNSKLINATGHRGTANATNNLVSASNNFTSAALFFTILTPSASTTLSMSVSSTAGSSGISGNIVFMHITGIKG